MTVASATEVGFGANGCVPVTRLTLGGANTLNGVPIGPLKLPINPLTRALVAGFMCQS